MNIKRISTIVLSVLMSISLLSSTANAQVVTKDPVFTKEDISKFISINKETLPIQMKAQTEMMSIISESGIDMQKFQQMAQASQKGDATMGGATEEEQTKFKTAADKLTALQEDLGNKMAEAVKAKGLDPVKFQMMAIQYTQNAEFRKKVDAQSGQ